RKGWLRRTSCILIVALLFQVVGAPLATQRLLRLTIDRLEEAGELSHEADATLSFLREVERSLAPTAWAAPLGHDPGDTASESGDVDEEDPCKQGHAGGSQVQYDGRALILTEALGSGCQSIIATYHSRYDPQRMLLSAWIPTGTPIERWEIHIQGWSFEGTGAHPMAWWDTTDHDTGKPVPQGLYFFETIYSNQLSTGATVHPVLVRRADDGPLGYNWTHSFQARLVPADGDHVIIETSGTWLLFVRQRQGRYVTSAPGEGTLTPQADGSWIWDRTGGDGSPINGRVAFDPQGRLAGFQDRAGNETHLTYDAQGRLTLVTDPVGRQTRLHYDQAGHIVQVTEPGGTVWTLSYDAGNLVEIRNPLGYRWAFEYDDAHRLTARTDPRGNSTRYTYDQWGGVTSIVDAAGDVTTYETDYDTEPLLVDDPSKAIPARGTTTVTQYAADKRETSRRLYTFDDDGQVIRFEQVADGGATRLTWEYQWGRDSQKGLLLAVVDPKGEVTQFRYESGTQLLTSIRRPGLPRTRLDYTSSAQAGWVLTSLQRGSDVRIVAEYDEQGLPRRVRRGDTGYWLRWTGPEAGLRGLPAAIIWKSDGKGEPEDAPEARILSLEYDRLGQLVALTDPLDRRTTWAYDAAGRPVEVVDALGRRTQYEYDALGRIVRQVDVAGGETLYRYDENGNLVEWVDALGRSTRLAYDHKDRLIWRQDPLGREVHLGWDNEGRLIWREDARGARVEFGYDGLGRLSSITFPTGETWRMEHDELGRVTRVIHPAATWRYEYDAAGNLVRAVIERGERTAELRYRYDSGGRLARLETGSGLSITYRYGGYGELTSVESPLGEVSLRYATRGEMAPVLTQVRSGPLTASLAHDAGGRLTELSYRHSRWSGDRAVTLRYSYDLVDNVIAREDQSGTTTYAYDLLDQLIGVSYPDGTEARYSYDAVGNRVEAVTPAGTVRYAYDAANQLVSANDTRYYHDANGYLIGAWQGDRGRVFGWDYQGHLRGVYERAAEALPFPLSLADAKTQPSALAAYRYDLLGQPVDRQTATGEVTRYLYSQQHAVEEYGAGGEPLARSVYTNRWDQLAAWDQGEPRDALYPLSDAMGTVFAAVDRRGEMHHEAQYDPWGVPLASGADDPLPGFQGRPYDAGTGLYNLRARYYDPALGRFLSPDPSVDPLLPRTLNGYAFGLNNPLRYRDPTGRIVPLVAAIVIGAAFGAAYYSAHYAFSTPSRCFSYGEFFKHMALGALIGAAVGGVTCATAGLVTAAGGGAVLAGAVGGGAAGFTESILRQSLIEGRHDGEIDWGDVAISTLVGTAGGALGGYAASRMVGPITGLSQPGRQLLEYELGWLGSAYFTVGVGFGQKLYRWYTETQW
ncbi:MAG: RHS repeat-associated core domain-containing protein, partial [Anaerolineae bacterium]|nr:RHS repeat-associated core domain-containing protein [Anaerolineae bacterium]